MNLFDAIFRDDRQSAALIYQGTSISYSELRQRTIDMAKVIVSLGTNADDRIVLLLNDSPEFIQAFIAICSLGAIAVPINPALTVEDQNAIIHNCRARFAIVDSDFIQSLVTSLTEVRHFPEKVLTVERNPEPRYIDEPTDHFTMTMMTIERPGKPSTDVRSLQDLLDETRSNAQPSFASDGEDKTAFILYTSGSTGEPKGAMHSQAHVFHTNNAFCREVLKLTPADRLFSSSRLPFAYGLGNSFSFPLLNGATSVLCRAKPTAEIISRTLAEARPTIFFAVPVVYNLLLEYHRAQQPLDCSSLRMCVSAGEALPAHLGEQWEKTFGVPVLDGIGSTEMLHMFMSNQLNDVCYGSSGKVLSGYEAKLLDERGEPSAEGVQGNLWIKGASAASGYWERPEETARTFVDGWVRTGDLYRCDDNGHWFHMGRSDDCFKSSGQWVSPVEVEGVLLRHKDVARVAVVESFDDAQLPCACAFVVAQADTDVKALENDLQSLSASSLPRFKRPRKYIFVSELPYTATGKIQRFKLRQQLRAGKKKSTRSGSQSVP